jgi:transposase-like protein
LLPLSRREAEGRLKVPLPWQPTEILKEITAAVLSDFQNLADLARDLGVAVNTAKAWFSVLEAGYQVIVLRDGSGHSLVPGGSRRPQRRQLCRVPRRHASSARTEGHGLAVRRVVNTFQLNPFIKIQDIQNCKILIYIAVFDIP